MEYLIVLLVLLAVVLVVTGPLRAAGRQRGEHDADAEPITPAHPEPDAVELAELEAAREAKYREIRDAELDHATGKLSDEDFAAVDGRLRAEAVEILRQIDQLAAERAAGGES